MTATTATLATSSDHKTVLAQLLTRQTCCTTMSSKVSCHFSVSMFFVLVVATVLPFHVVVVVVVVVVVFLQFDAFAASDQRFDNLHIFVVVFVIVFVVFVAFGDSVIFGVQQQQKFPLEGGQKTKKFSSVSKIGGSRVFVGGQLACSS